MYDGSFYTDSLLSLFLIYMTFWKGTYIEANFTTVLLFSY